MITARGGGHHRGGRPAERHLYLAGVDFSQDPAVAGPGAVVGRLMLARLESGGLLTPEGPPGDSDDGGFSPFIAMIPPGLGFGRGGLQQPTGPQTQSAQDTPLAAARAQATGLTPAVAAETPETPPDVPPPVLPPEPTIVPDPPAPPVIVVVEIPPVIQPPPAPAPPPETRPTPLIQSVAAPAVVAAVAAIPEPGTWAMLLLGFGAVGAAIRNRRRGQPAPEGSC